MKLPKSVKLKGNQLPETPGVYLMKDASGGVLYVGKAGNLKRRVSSYFEKAHEFRIEKLVREVRRIDYEKTDTAIEALIREAELIKRFSPAFNVRDKDDKSFLYVEITKEEFPRVLLVRGKEVKDQGSGMRDRFGPFTSASSIREALRILRRIFPWNIHPPETLGKFSRPCFDYEIGLCPGTCIGKAKKSEYRKDMGNLKLIFKGRKRQILKRLDKEMRQASKNLEFENAEKLRRQIFSLKHIQDVAFVSDDVPTHPGDRKRFRIEGYDVSNISGTLAVGAMVVFRDGSPDKEEYRKFKIRTVRGTDDVGMLKEVLRRRFHHTPREGGWALPNLILIDGGRAQVNAARRVLEENGLRIPVVGIAKGPKRRKNEFLGGIPRHVEPKTLIRVRDEAHRFAIGYHKHIRRRAFLSR